jgi:hypothetical protein
LSDAGGTLVAVPTSWLLAAFAVAAQAATGSRVLLESAAGKIESRELSGFECTDPRAVGAALVRFEGLKVPPAPATDDEKAELALPGGDHLFGRIHGGRAELVDIEILGGVHLGLALDEITSLVFPARVPAHGTIVPVPAHEGDRLYRRAGGGLDVIDGGIEEFTTGGVRIHGQNVGSKLVSWSEIAALFVEGVPTAASKAHAADAGVPVSLDLRDGGRLRGSLQKLSAEGCRLTTRNGERVLVPAPAIALVTVDDGALAFLSSIPAEASPPSLPFGDDLGMRWESRIDRSVSGAQLVAGGRMYPRGLGIHTPGRMSWKLDGTWKHLRGAVAIDDEVLRLPSRGSVVFRVIVDGKVRFESRELHGGDPPAPIEAVDLTGATELELVVEPSDGSTVADRADWLSMILWR